jgi:hypothetical protein
MQSIYLDDIDYNNKEQIIDWCINNIDENNIDEIDEKVINYLLTIDSEKINKLDNYIRKHYQDGSKDSNPCCRGKYETSIDCHPFCLGCYDSIARLRKYFHLILNLTIQCEKLIVLIKTNNFNQDQQKEFIDKLLEMCKEFLPINQSGKILEMILKNTVNINIDKLIEKIYNEYKEK